MTAGQAFEALNHAGGAGTDMLVILNDNCMSIDPNVGALKEYLTDITTSHTYNKVKDDVWKLLGKISKFGPNAQAIAQKVENAVKSACSSRATSSKACSSATSARWTATMWTIW
jgi:1-deoxy-D-xylulose-5-phosphate synthase